VNVSGDISENVRMPLFMRAGLKVIRHPVGLLRRRIRRELDGRLHPGRRARALTLIRTWPVPKRVAVLCLGNVCRSPYAEAYLRKNGWDLGMEFQSGGFIGPDRPPPGEALAAAGKRNLDTSDHISKTITTKMVAATDLILLVNPKHLSRLRREVGLQGNRYLILGDLDPEPIDSRAILDPWGEPPEVFDEVFGRIDRCLDVLMAEWRARGV
jgi:protein-tyrosine phosphatase